MLLKPHNIYVVGTGRCGTMSLASTWGGMHEPEPNIIYEATRFYLGDTGIQEKLIEKIKARKNLKTRIIVDNKQSTIIPLLKEVDSKAEYVLLVREPMPCIESFYARGAYSQEEHLHRKPIWVDNRLRPITDFPKDWTTFMKCTWYWVEVHRVILSTIGGAKFSIVYTDEIGSDLTQNQSKKEQHKRLHKKQQCGLSTQEKIFYDNYAVPIWEEIKRLHDTLQK